MSATISRRTPQWGWRGSWPWTTPTPCSSFKYKMKRAAWSCSQLSAAGHVTEPNLAKGQSKTSLISRSHGQSASVLFSQVALSFRPHPPSALKIFNFFQTFPCVSYVSSFHLVLKSQPTKTRSCKMFLFSIFLHVNFPKRPLHLKKKTIKSDISKAVRYTMNIVINQFTWYLFLSFPWFNLAGERFWLSILTLTRSKNVNNMLVGKYTSMCWSIWKVDTEAV